MLWPFLFLHIYVSMNLCTNDRLCACTYMCLFDRCYTRLYYDECHILWYFYNNNDPSIFFSPCSCRVTIPHTHSFSFVLFSASLLGIKQIQLLTIRKEVSCQIYELLVWYCETNTFSTLTSKITFRICNIIFKSGYVSTITI